MTKELSKAIISKYEAKSKYIKQPCCSLKKKKKKKNRCKSISKKAKQKYFKNITKGGFMNNKKFWDSQVFSNQ